jgi:hypothetical protein
LERITRLHRFVTAREEVVSGEMHEAVISFESSGDRLQERRMDDAGEYSVE